MPNEAHLRLLHSRWQDSVTEQRDTLGRSAGYIYAKNGIPQQQTTIGYGADGRVNTAGFTHQGENKLFTYTYLPGTHLLHTLTHPNGLTLTQSYEPQRDLPTQMDYTRAGALIVRRGYDYDLLGRPTARSLARYGTETSDTFGYNTRSESPRGLGGGLDNARSGIAPKGRAGNGVPVSQLTSAHVNSADYSYAYDAIGNRAAAVENSSGVASRTEYRTNNLNQYTAEGTFTPTFDADGNQTLIKTSTGIWSVTYNAKNRPVLFTKSDGSVTEHRRFSGLVKARVSLQQHPRERALGGVVISWGNQAQLMERAGMLPFPFHSASLRCRDLRMVYHREWESSKKRKPCAIHARSSFFNAECLSSISYRKNTMSVSCRAMRCSKIVAKCF